MPTTDRFGVVYYKPDEELPPKKWYMLRTKTRFGYEDMPYWQVAGRIIAVGAVLVAVVLILMKVGELWDENTYGYSDCVADRMAQYQAKYGQQGEAFRPEVESDCQYEYRR